MTRMFPEHGSTQGGTAPAAEVASPGGGWSILPGAVIAERIGAGAVAAIAVHREFGLALLEHGDAVGKKDAALAVAAMRVLLDEVGFTQRYPGRLPVLALSLRGEEGGELGRRLEDAFAAARAAVPADPTWADWLIDRLAPGGGSAADQPAPPAARARPLPREPERLYTDRADAWRVGEAASGRSGSRAAAPLSVRPAEASRAPAAGLLTAEPPATSEAASARPTSWLGMVLALVVVCVVLVGMALLSHGNGAPAGASRAASAPAETG